MKKGDTLEWQGFELTATRVGKNGTWADFEYIQSDKRHTKRLTLPIVINKTGKDLPEEYIVVREQWSHDVTVRTLHEVKTTAVWEEREGAPVASVKGDGVAVAAKTGQPSTRASRRRNAAQLALYMEAMAVAKAKTAHACDFDRDSKIMQRCDCGRYWARVSDADDSDWAMVNRGDRRRQRRAMRTRSRFNTRRNDQRIKKYGPDDLTPVAFPWSNNTSTGKRPL